MPVEGQPSGRTSNAVRVGDQFEITIGNAAPVRVAAGTMIVTADGRQMTVEDASRGGIEIRSIALDASTGGRGTSDAGANLNPWDDPDPNANLNPWDDPGGIPQPAPTSAGGGGGSPGGASAPAPATEEEGFTGFRGVPPNGKLGKIDGTVYWGRDVHDPETGEVVGFVGWAVPEEDLETLIGEESGEMAFDVTLAEAEAFGFLNGGILSEVSGGPEDDPLENWLEDWTEQMSLSPMYGDDEILALATMAAIEGREITANELQGTDWWRGQNEAQRAWGELVATDPQQAALIQRNNRDTIRERFWAAGWAEVPDGLVDYVADKWTTGEFSQADAFRQVQRETDPFAAGASPYAGLTEEAFAELGWQVITDGTDYWVRTADGDYRVNGEGGIARLAHMAGGVQAKPDGRHVVANGTHYFVDADGNYHVASGPGQVAGLERLYGPAEEVERGHYDREGNWVPFAPAVSGSVVELFGGAGGIEAVGEVNEVGTSASLAEGATVRDATGLGEEERVREMLRQYVGPYHAKNYSDAWVAEQAGRLRNEGPGAIDVLTQKLQADFQSLFAGYDGNNVSYESIAGPSRGLWQRYSGNEVDEDSTAWVEFLAQGPNAPNREAWLRRQGLNNDWAPVSQEMYSGIGSAAGSQTVRTASV